MTDPVATFVQRWNALVTAPAADDGERWRSFRQAAGEATAQLGADAERLVAVIGHGIRSRRSASSASWGGDGSTASSPAGRAS